MNTVIPTIFAHSRKEFDERLKQLLPFAKQIHVDVMDGQFVLDKSLDVDDIPNLKKYPVVFEAHLMVYSPIKYVDILKKKRFEKILFHIEACDSQQEIREMISLTRKKKMQVFLALNARTLLAAVKPYLSEIDGILVMGIQAGQEHQEFVSKVYVKIHALRKIAPKLAIQVDGGVNFTTVEKLRACGATLVNSGSFIHEASDPEEAYRELVEIFGNKEN